DLSVQVHPDDNLARKRHNSFGKTEMWYIVDSDADASIAFGFSQQIDFDQLTNLVEQGKLVDALAKYNTRPGDCFLIPAGRVHTIGAGNLIIEIQRNSDITYRIDDFNRRDANGNLRELHLQLAKDAIDYSVKDNFRTTYHTTPGSIAPIVECDYFKTDFLELAAGTSTELHHIDSFRIIVCIEGSVTLTDDFGNITELTQGHSALIAACSQKTIVTANGAYSKALLCNI
ncbi:MAG: class I mannose-6-phosphate isomerase, partial [Muribaculaceae bacterium]|nr:class I mannose-6-phosphate isomerase [Muribaculaceae bacterium]